MILTSKTELLDILKNHELNMKIKELLDQNEYLKSLLTPQKIENIPEEYKEEGRWLLLYDVHSWVPGRWAYRDSLALHKAWISQTGTPLQPTYYLPIPPSPI